MKFTRTLAVAGLCSLAAMGASAEQYQGALQFQSTASRAEVQAPAVAAAKNGDAYAEGVSVGVAPTLVSTVDRAAVRADAVEAAHSEDAYAEAASSGVAPLLNSTVDCEAVRAEAGSTAHATQATL